jgi:hypothetical protein
MTTYYHIIAANSESQEEEEIEIQIIVGHLGILLWV